jgi:C4-dicarboxylate transporter, DctM subunit
MLNSFAGAFRRLIDLCFDLGSFTLVAASAVLTGGVVAAQMLGRGIEWQDELEIFHAAGAVFLSAAAVQARRGNDRIEVLTLCSGRKRAISS